LQAGGENKTLAAEPRVWIVSPAVPVDAGNLLEITGWVRVDRPFGRDDGGLAILDTLGGPELSLVVQESSGWQPFRILRAAPKAAELRLTFAVTGTGSAKVDAVMVRNLQQPIARRLPEVVPSSRASHDRTADGSTQRAAESVGPLFGPPQTR
jgi:hypothetical protein